MYEYNMTYPNELYHYGVKGMKWGVRRYQNKDGSYTSEGKKRREQDPETIQKRKAIAKKVAVATVAAVGVSVAAAYAAKNPEAISRVMQSVGKTTVNALKTGKSKTVAYGKKAVKSAMSGVKEGLNESIKEAPKKATKAVVTGLTLNATKRFLDSTLGKEESARIFQANEKKKISSFWKVNDSRDKDDDDDD